MSVERKSIVERITELSKKLDVIFFAIGGVVYLFSPGVGLVIIIGNAITYVTADQIEKWYKKRKR
ncbi:MAG: hypothetical protein ACD_19C00074G0001 [uncultured bacterium]|uniref:Uncharacterized protein n=1 Tax=Candidatus Woesebacteria bacterium RIFCSPLOWO2_01_FULL_39_21 TaxID=1802519 RepID=A0A1F8BMH9_9BACT|nr:MAG: hypothetical protein ACD_19C00074G0001 [uncultured bacterium]OGM22822.1 MAG: hypothetical protein A2691_00790 [Candidatus Woesebacteria bacterium RIFCSPHIGHO2_01_FULL_39_23]OGM65267.1 MAG: hypothetical protein A2961_01490 [Candidatus Woesebacteria bacterium RIFCSPLOWO2_01_FULL_39_21]